MPAAVVHFVQTNLSSIEELEMLMLMQSRAGVRWTVETLARELGSTKDSMAKRSADFIALRIIEAIPEGGGQGFTYAPASPDLAELLRAVVQTYRERRIAMTTLIYERPSMPLRSFADAFRLRKDEPS